MKRIICIVGSTSTGKDEILKSALKLNEGLKPVVSHTTRPIRSNEDGSEYHFISVEQATKMLNNSEFIETRQYNVAIGETWLYGIHKSEIDLNSNNNYICIVDFQGLKKLKKYLQQNNKLDSLVSIYINADYQIRLQRALSREGKMTNEQVLEVIRRFEDDRQFVEPSKSYCDMCFSNNNIQDMIKILSEIKNLI